MVSLAGPFRINLDHETLTDPSCLYAQQELTHGMPCHALLIFQVEVDHFHYLIDKDYRVHMQLDNLPIAIGQIDSSDEDPARSSQEER